MSSFGFSDVLAVAHTSGTAVANTTTKTSLTPPSGRFTNTRTNGFWTLGKTLRVTAAGTVSTFTSGTLTLSFGVGSVDAWASQALTMVASQSNQTWRLQLLMTVRAVGAGGSATASLIGVGAINAGSAITAAETLLPATTPAVGTAFDPGSPALLDLFATWSVASASNTIATSLYVLEALN